MSDLECNETLEDQEHSKHGKQMNMPFFDWKSDSMDLDLL
jgi:hypothetical protein